MINMPGIKTYINSDNFYLFLKHNYPDFNLYNIDYVEKIKNDFFSIYGNNITKCKALSYFNKYLNSKYSSFKSKVSIKYWNLMGYDDKNEIINKIKKYKKDCHVTVNEFDDKVQYLIENINLNNKERINELKHLLFSDELCLGTVEFNKRLTNAINEYGKAGTLLKTEYWTFRGWALEEAKEKISKLQKTYSPRCKEYYINKGFSEEEAITMQSKKQSIYSNNGKHSKKFWMNKGFSEEEALEIAKDYTQTYCSIWHKKFWMNKGFSEEEALEKMLMYNPSSPKFFKYDNDYEKYKIKLERWSRIAKKRWQTDEYRDKVIERIKDGSIKVTSKTEINVFNTIKEWNNKIKHEPYIIVIPDDFENAINISFYTVDGYYIDDEGVILIEYDSTIYHNEELDFIRDSNILSIDTNVLGIIRIQQSFIKNLSFKKDIFENAIQTIKNSKENRIILH